MELDYGVDSLQITDEEVNKQIEGEKGDENQEDFRTLKIATHNINGIKGNSVKLELLLEWAKKEKIDLLGINETNTTEIQNRHRLKNQNDYLGIWTNAEENKKKGSGIGLIMNKKWEKHLSQVKRSNTYYLEALFVFKRQKVLIIVVYIPHNDQKIRKNIQQQVIKKAYDCINKNTKVIIFFFFFFFFNINGEAMPLSLLINN